MTVLVITVKILRAEQEDTNEHVMRIQPFLLLFLQEFFVLFWHWCGRYGGPAHLEICLLVEVCLVHSVLLLQGLIQIIVLIFFRELF